MENDPTHKSAKDSLVEALGETQEENIIGKPDEPSFPLYGSENVPISRREENEAE